ncbi:MAG: DUF3596 domain-containing protein [Oculatellaceae cyanobacterium bins.114]|nr:DUF3596 domain-containing protein [Oculatellaceae cyanobacterium bins.114]
MYSKPSKRKAKVGTVQIKNLRDRLSLVFSYGGKRHFLSLGMANTPLNRMKAQQTAFQIQRDIEYGEFDSTYRKYKAQPVATSDVPVALKLVPTLSLKDLWEQYVEIRKVGKSPATIRMYGWVAKHLERCPYDSPNEAHAIFDWLTVNVPADSARRILVQLNACCKWAMNLGKLDSTPFLGMASKIKLKVVDEEEDINPFTREERDRIIVAFEKNRYYKYYTPLIGFLFFTGCRPSEALALMWKTVGNQHIKFEQALIFDGHSLVLTPGLKTQKSRKFPVNAQLSELMKSIRPLDVQPDTLVFPSPKGSFIDWSNFTNRAWKKVLATLPDIEYRNPYQTRHTFCSLCREVDIASIQIAKWVGNSAEMIDRVYAKPVKQVQVPEL